MSRIQSAVPQQVNQALQVAGDQNLKQKQIDNAAMANAATAKNQAERTQAMLRGQDQDLFTNAANRDARFASEQIALKEAQISREQTDKLERDKIAAQQQMNADRIKVDQEDQKLRRDMAKQEEDLIKEKNQLDADLALAKGKDRDALIELKKLHAAKLAKFKRKQNIIGNDQGEINILFSDEVNNLKEGVYNITEFYEGYDETIASNLLPTNLKDMASPDMASGKALRSSSRGLFTSTYTEKEIAEFISNPANATNFLVDAFSKSMLEIANSSDETTNGNLEALSRRLMRDLVTKGEVDPYIFARAEKAGIDPMMLQQAAHSFALQVSNAYTEDYADLAIFDADQVSKNGKDIIPGLTGELEGMTVQDAGLIKSVFNQTNATNLVNGTKDFFNVNAVKTYIEAMNLENTDSVRDTFEDVYDLTNQDDLDLTFVRDLAGQLDLTVQQLIDSKDDQEVFEAQSALEIANPLRANELEVYKLLSERLKK